MLASTALVLYSGSSVAQTSDAAGSILPFARRGTSQSDPAPPASDAFNETVVAGI